MTNNNNFNPLKEKYFARLIIAGFLTGLSFSIFIFTETWYVVDNLDMEKAIGIVMIMATLPRVIFMGLGGVLADKYNKNSIIIFSISTRLILMSIIISLLYFEAFTIVMVAIIALLNGLLDALFWPSQNSIVPYLVKEENLTKANSIIRGTNEASMLLGPLLAGAIISAYGYTIVFLFIFVILLIAVFVFKSFNHLRYSSISDNHKSYKSLLTESISYILNSKYLFHLMIGMIAVNFLVVGPLYMGLPLFVSNILEGSVLNYSWLKAALSIGILVGALIVGILNIKHNRGKYVFKVLLLLSISMITLSLLDSLSLSILVVFIIGISLSGSQIPIYSIVYSHVDKKMLGRVMSFLTMASLGLVPVSYGFTSILIYFGVNMSQILLYSGILTSIFIILIFTLSPRLRNIQ